MKPRFTHTVVFGYMYMYYGVLAQRTTGIVCSLCTEIVFILSLKLEQCSGYLGVAFITEEFI